MDISSLQPFLDWVESHRGLSGIVVFAIAAFESLAVVGIFVPGIVFMLGIGALIGLQVMDFKTSILWAASGAVAGDGFSYWLGRHFDKQLKSLWPFSKYTYLIPRGERFFHKHGGKSVIIGRFIGPVRPIIPMVAGIMRMNPYYFYSVNVFSAIVWAPVVLLPGVVFGSSLHLASEVSGRLVILLLITAAFAWLLIVGSRTLVTPLLLRLFGRWEEHWDFVVRNAFNSAIVLTVLLLAGGAYYVYVNMDQFRYPVRHISDLEQWQRNAWQQLPVYREARDKEDPFTMQWWGSLETIKDGLQSQRWRSAKTLDFENAIMWLSPTPQIESLPLFPRWFRGEKQTLLMVRKIAERRQLILRLWPAFSDTGGQNTNLWVGTVYVMELRDAGYKIFYATISSDQDATRRQLLAALPQTVRVKKVKRNTTTDNWDGNIVLVMPQ